MWVWANEEKVSAMIENEDGTWTTCGVNVEPLSSLLAEGFEPKPYENQETA